MKPISKESAKKSTTGTNTHVNRPFNQSSEVPEITEKCNVSSPLSLFPPIEVLLIYRCFAYLALNIQIFCLCFLTFRMVLYVYIYCIVLQCPLRWLKAAKQQTNFHQVQHK